MRKTKKNNKLQSQNKQRDNKDTQVLSIHTAANSLRKESMNKKTLVPPIPILVGDRSILDVNALIISITTQDQRSILINEENNPAPRQALIDDNFHKRKSVFERLGRTPTNSLRPNNNTSNNNADDQYNPDQYRGCGNKNQYNDQPNNYKQPRYDPSDNHIDQRDQRQKKNYDTSNKDNHSTTKQ